MSTTRSRAAAVAPWVAAAAVLVLGAASLFVGVIDLSPRDLITDADARHVFVVSRAPRTTAIVLAGAAMAVAGLIMQHLARNRFVAPTTVGTVDAAALGLLVATISFAGSSVMTKIGFALVFAFAASTLFLVAIQRIQFKDIIFVPLVGLVFGGVLRAISDFFAYRHNLVQTLDVWLNGDFSGVIQGRYETLYLAGAAAVIAYVFANRITVAGLGRDFATSVGVRYTAVLLGGLAVASFSTAVVVVTVGAIPFLGLIVPNVATMIVGDNMRRALPVTAFIGAGVVLACDIVARVVIAPYEIPVGTVLGVIGAVVFLGLILRRSAYDRG